MFESGAIKLNVRSSSGHLLDARSSQKRAFEELKRRAHSDVGLVIQERGWDGLGGGTQEATTDVVKHGVECRGGEAAKSFARCGSCPPACPSITHEARFDANISGLAVVDGGRGVFPSQQNSKRRILDVVAATATTAFSPAARAERAYSLYWVRCGPGRHRPGLALRMTRSISSLAPGSKCRASKASRECQYIKHRDDYKAERDHKKRAHATVAKRRGREGKTESAWIPKIDKNEYHCTR